MAPPPCGPSSATTWRTGHDPSRRPAPRRAGRPPRRTPVGRRVRRRARQQARRHPQPNEGDLHELPTPLALRRRRRRRRHGRRHHRHRRRRRHAARPGGRRPGPAGQSDHATKEPKPSNDASEPTPSETTAPPSSSVVPVYFAGDTPSGPRLYREFHPNADGADPLMYAAATSVAGSAGRPGLRHPVAVRRVRRRGDLRRRGHPHGRASTVRPTTCPSGMTQDEAQLALQQVVYSVQAAHGQGRVGVQFLLDGERSDQILGQPTSEPLANAPILKTLSLVSLSSPVRGRDGQRRHASTVEGVANSFEANVIVRLQRWEGTEVVAEAAVHGRGLDGRQAVPVLRHARHLRRPARRVRPDRDDRRPVRRRGGVRRRSPTPG